MKTIIKAIKYLMYFKVSSILLFLSSLLGAGAFIVLFLFVIISVSKVD